MARLRCKLAHMTVILYTCLALLKTAAAGSQPAHQDTPGAMRAPRRASSPIPPLHHRAQPTSLHRGTLRLHCASRARPTAPQRPPPLALAKSPPETHRVSTNCSCTTLLPLPTGVATLTQPPGSTPARRQQPPPAPWGEPRTRQRRTPCRAGVGEDPTPHC